MKGSTKMPVLFVGHGSPMNAIESNRFSRGWRGIAARMPRPKAIVCLSAHWLKEGTAATAMEHPKTIHDFYGFPEKLYKARYPAKGSPKLAERIRRAVKTAKVGLDREWGLDHGTWSVLAHMYPKADVPVLQLSLDYMLPLEKMFRLGKELAAFRKEGILIIGSGNLVHNLMTIRPGGKPFPWAVDFDRFVERSLYKRDYEALIEYTDHPSARIAHPTNDHYLPLIYSIGAAGHDEPHQFNEGIVFGSVSMRCAAFGLDRE